MAKKQLWAAAAKPEQAVALVLAAVPEGWSATLSETQLQPTQINLLKLEPGEVRELTPHLLTKLPPEDDV